VNLGRVAWWLKEGRWIAAGAGLLAGFLISTVLYSEPWHLQPAWGDLATWITALFAGVAGGIGLRQLSLLRQQVADESEQNAKRDQAFDAELKLNARRDELITRQLAEAERRAVSDRRIQAEDVVVRWGMDALGVVVNNSRRPIRRVTCKIMSNVDQKVLKLPESCGELPEVNDEIADFLLDPTKPLPEFAILRPEAGCGFLFGQLTVAPDEVLVAWFTDDADFRWQLDEYLHLAQADDGEEHEYRQ
jgi:hypothetical protein